MSLTEEEYVKKLGLICPNCEATEGIYGSSPDGVNIDDGIAWQEIRCTLCKAGWTDNYNLVGYSQLEVPEKEDITNIQHPPNQQVAENWARIASERKAEQSND